MNISDERLNRLLKHLNDPTNYCLGCHKPCSQDHRFCGFCGAANPNFNLKALKKDWEVESIEEAQKVHCPDFHKFENLIDAEQPFCIFCGIDAAENSLMGSSN